MKKCLTLLVLIGVLSVGAVATQQVIKVKFKPGAYAATYQGNISSGGRGETFDRYILGAAGGQTLQVAVRSSDPVYVYVWTGDFNKGFVSQVSGDRKAYLKVRLPHSGDYKVDINSTSSQNLDYEVKFTIR